jgi:hypothetical protein
MFSAYDMRANFNRLTSLRLLIWTQSPILTYEESKLELNMKVRVRQRVKECIMGEKADITLRH